MATGCTLRSIISERDGRNDVKLRNPRAQFYTTPQGVNSLVVVGDTVHLVGEVNCEGDAIQTLVAHDASEAAWVIGLPHCL